jgi:hypothetical protein
MAESLEVRRATTSVSVEIYDQTYNLRASDPEYIQKLAAMVDGKMRAVSANGSTVDSLRVAVLAALNITAITVRFQLGRASIPGRHLPISFADVSIHSETGLQSRCGS